MERIKQLLQSIVGGVLPDALGKGPGFVGFAVLQAALTTLLIARFHVEGATIAAAFGPLDAALYSAGAWKVHSDNKTAANGSGNGSVAK